MSDFNPSDLSPDLSIPEPKPEATEEPRQDFSPDDMVPDLTPKPHQRSWWFHVGLLPECTNDAMSIGGVGLCKSTSVVTRKANKQIRIDKQGSIMRLTKPQLERFLDRLRRTVMRPTYVSESTGRPIHKAIKIPTEEERERHRRYRGRDMPEFRPQEGDVPLSSLVYLRCLATPTASPVPWDNEFPPPLSQTGFTFPGDDVPEAKPSR